MKQSHVIALDDGYFPQHAKRYRLPTVIAAVLFKEERPVTATLSIVNIDGLDATATAATLIQKLKQHMETHADSVVLLDGVTYAGFNVINPIDLHLATSLPIVVIVKPIRFDRALKALLKNFPGTWYVRWLPLKWLQDTMTAMDTPYGRIFFAPLGIDEKHARDILRRYQVTSAFPEPLRVAHYIASEASKYLLYRT